MSNPVAVAHRDPGILGGAPVFVGTRVPAKSLFDHLDAGDSLDEFLESFPSVSRAHAVAAPRSAWSSGEAVVEVGDESPPACTVPGAAAHRT